MRTTSLVIFVLVALGCGRQAVHSGALERASSTGGSTHTTAAPNMRERPTVIVPSVNRSLAGAPALTQVEPPATRDEGLPTHAEIDLRERVQRALLSEESLSYTAKHARVEVEHHDVTLYGEARTSREKLELSEIVRDVEGVRRVDNRIVVINRTPHAVHMHAAPR